MIWRDDDILWKSHGLDQLLRVDDLFQEHARIHTVAIIAATLTPTVAASIRARRMRAQLHCWEHDDLTIDAKAVAKLPDALARIADLVGERPTILYPPWNRSNRALEQVAAALGLKVSTEKASLEQFLRCGGDVREDTINFHYWHPPDVAQLAEALQLDRRTGCVMKKTDYCARAAPFDAYLTGHGLIGVEIGVDVGAHAEALLRHCDIASLTLVDRWPRDYHYGYCEGRLAALGFRPRFHMLPKSSVKAAAAFELASLDFVYIDQAHDGSAVATDLLIWWPTLKRGGVLGYRNYSATPTPLSAAVEAFVAAHAGELDAHVEVGEIVLVKR